MRCFIGIDLPIVAVKEIQKIQKKLELNSKVLYGMLYIAEFNVVL